MSTKIYTVIAPFAAHGPRISWRPASSGFLLEPRGSFIGAPLRAGTDRLVGDTACVGGPQSANRGWREGTRSTAGSGAGPRSARAATAAPTRATAAAAMNAAPKPAAGA